MEQHFWSRVDKTGDCWLWTGSTTGGGYGRVRRERKSKSIYAHRMSWELLVGPIPQGMEIDHLCHVRRCVNPEHLRVATHQENMQNLKGAPVNSKSGVRGVHWHVGRRKWAVEASFDGKRHWGGYFHDFSEAERAAVDLRQRLSVSSGLDRVQ